LPTLIRTLQAVPDGRGWACALKEYLAHGERFVHDEDVRIDVDGDCKRQPHVHAAGVGLDGLIDEVTDVGEREDVVETLLGLLSRKPRIPVFLNTFSRPLNSGLNPIPSSRRALIRPLVI